MPARLVEILTFDGCPNGPAAIELARQVVAETEADATVEVVTVLDPEHATELRFLGSPTIRVDGRDIEPGADDRQDFALACRIYQLGGGHAGQPDVGWLQEALTSTRTN